MKKVILLTAASLCIVFISNAQISKGSKLLGIDLSTGYSKSSGDVQESRQSSFYANPSVGVAIKTNTVLGVEATYGHGKTTSNYNPMQESNTYGAGVFMRRYLQLGKRTYLFGQADAGYQHSKTEQRSGSFYNSTSKENAVSLSAYPGLSFAVSNRFLIEAGLSRLIAISYQKNNQTINNSGSVTNHEYSSFSASSVLGGNTSFSLGFRILLPK